jgi:hypothetical protein
MKKRLEIGDVFQVSLEGGKKYMQFIADDWKQLNSSVLRVFKKLHSQETEFNVILIENDEEEFCVHITDIKQGEKDGLWEKVANEEIVYKDKDIFFKGSYDYGNPEVKESKDWYVWRLGEEKSQEVSFDDEILHKAYIGTISQPQHVFEMVEHNGEFQGFYPKHK